jgi:hypothetical protein
LIGPSIVEHPGNPISLGLPIPHRPVISEIGNRNYPIQRGKWDHGGIIWGDPGCNLPFSSFPSRFWNQKFGLSPMIPLLLKFNLRHWNSELSDSPLKYKTMNAGPRFWIQFIILPFTILFHRESLWTEEPNTHNVHMSVVSLLWGPLKIESPGHNFFQNGWRFQCCFEDRLCRPHKSETTETCTLWVNED